MEAQIESMRGNLMALKNKPAKAVRACHFSDFTSTPYPRPRDSTGASCSSKRYNQPKEQVLEGYR
jgi:hypothetical protein